MTIQDIALHVAAAYGAYTAAAAGARRATRSRLRWRLHATRAVRRTRRPH